MSASSSVSPPSSSSVKLSSESATLPLEEVKAQFAQWRGTRANQKSKLPDALWDAAKQLTKQHKSHHVAEELNLSGRRRQQLLAYSNGQADKHSMPINDFVQVSVPFVASSPVSDSAAPTPATGTLELLRTDGATLKASGLNPQNLYALIERFLVS
jgi:hypothetical protein